MALEFLANNALTTLNGAINGAVTSLVVTSATGFPAAGNFRLLIDSELLLVTAVAGTTFTVTRGVEGTAAAAHLDLAAVTCLLTKAGLETFRGDALQLGAYSALPAAAMVRYYQTSDAALLLRDTGAAWQAFGPHWPLTLPISTDFSWVNQGGATVSATTGPTVLSVPLSAGKNHRMRTKALPATPYTITALLQFVADPSDFWNVGLFFRDSATGKHHVLQMAQVTNPILASSKFTDPTTFSADYKTVALSLVAGNGPLWLRIADDATNRICSFSTDGFNFQVFHTVGNTDFLTADQVGFFGNSQNSQPVTLTLLSWKEG